MMRDPYDPHGGQYDNTDLPRAQDLDGRSIDEQRAADIAACQLCNPDGYRTGGTRCDHIDHAAIAERHRGEIHEALEKIAARKAADEVDP